jgi:hypothetical protein
LEAQLSVVEAAFWEQVHWGLYSGEYCSLKPVRTAVVDVALAKLLLQ